MMLQYDRKLRVKLMCECGQSFIPLKTHDFCPCQVPVGYDDSVVVGFSADPRK